MIQPELAQQELAKLRKEGWLECSMRDVGRLPARLRSLGYGLLGRAPDGQEIAGNWRQVNAAWREAALRLEGESSAGRLKVFAVLFPKLEANVEAGWQLHVTLPYQTGYVRKAFRAPHHRQLAVGRAAAWLESLSGAVSGYEQDITWWATWAAHHAGYNVGDALGLLFAAAINTGGPVGDEVFDILRASGNNEHEIGAMGRHVCRALLAAGRPDGWEFIEKMLIATQRQEGLRQTILECVDQAHPEAFRRMLRLILDKDLARFSAVVRAVDVWFGFQWDSAGTRVVNQAIELALTFFADDAARAKAIKTGTGDDLYLALWTTAFEDGVAAVDAAAPLLKDRDPKRRFIAAHLLGLLNLPQAQQKLLPALADDDLRIAWRALIAFPGQADDDLENTIRPHELFERVEKLLERIPAKGQILKAIVWPWMVFKVDSRYALAILAGHLGTLPPTRLIPYLGRMDAWSKLTMMDKLAQQKKWDAVTRTTLFALVGDTHGLVRTRAVETLAQCKIGDDEAVQLEGLLKRKANDLRRGVLSLLVGQKDHAALASSERLLAAKEPLQRLAGLEMLRELAAAKRRPGECLARTRRFQAERPRPTKEEQSFLDNVANAAQDKPTLDNALGLLDPAQRTQPLVPKKRLNSFTSAAAGAIIDSLDELVHNHREKEVVVKHRPPVYESDEDHPSFEDHDLRSETLLLGAITYQFPIPDARIPATQDVAYLPLADVWIDWWQNHPAEMRDQDGLELLRAIALLAMRWNDGRDHVFSTKKRIALSQFGDKNAKKVRYPWTIKHVLAWMLRLDAPAGAAEFLLDAVETSFALVPAEELSKVRETKKKPYDFDYGRDWRDGHNSALLIYLAVAREHRLLCPLDWTAAQHIRFFRLLRWQDESTPGMGRLRPHFDEALTAYKAGGATPADLFDHILGPPSHKTHGNDFMDLAELTTPKRRSAWIRQFPPLSDLTEQCRRRILEIELQRGDTATAASAPALCLRSVWGTAMLIRILRALGKDKFHRGYSFRNNEGKACVLSHLAAVCHPTDEDTPESTAAALTAADIGQDVLIALAFKAPQWVRHIERFLGWNGFAEGVWWFLAHTRDAGGQETKAWTALLAERTALSPMDLCEGAVDVHWFHRAYQAVGPKRWPALDEAAKFASMAGGYRRAQFLASVLLGKAKRKDLISDIRKKFHKEKVRALGLLPLATGAAHAKDLSERYQVIQEYHRYARGLSSMTRPAAEQAAKIGLANLARTAGYPDPLRFQWAMEAASLADLASGPITAKKGDLEVSLGIDPTGQVEWSVLRKGKPVHSIPGALTSKQIVELQERKKQLTRSQASMRRGLEDMMCRGDSFTAAELVQLMNHPLLAPMLGRLVVVGDGVVGYPEKMGRALRDHAGKLEPVKNSESLRLAHPHDLAISAHWHLWQRDCFQRELVQPFKQVFRELYVVTAAEKKDAVQSRRYAGQQIQPRQAMALWASRGWSAGGEEGTSKTFHDTGITAHVQFLFTMGTAAEVEGWTIETVAFHRVQDMGPMKLISVPPRLFSEIMRDMDLVVSVAHRGGVDPEASASTVEMRSSLLRELCQLLHLKNVRQKKQHVLIDGQRSQYSVHLGSGGVQRLPGGALSILPVHAQHRGRLFLPFADDDPKTAEILSKVLLLARDQDIQDPGILEQLRV